MESPLTTEFYSAAALAVCLIYRDLIVFLCVCAYMCTQCPSERPSVRIWSGTKNTTATNATVWDVVLGPYICLKIVAMLVNPRGAWEFFFSSSLLYFEGMDVEI